MCFNEMHLMQLCSPCASEPEHKETKEWEESTEKIRFPNILQAFIGLGLMFGSVEVCTLSVI